MTVCGPGTRGCGEQGSSGGEDPESAEGGEALPHLQG